MSGATAERENILKALRTTYTKVHAAGAAYAAAYQRAVTREDLVEAMGGMVEAIIAGEHLQETAAEAVKVARATLASTMTDTGCFNISTGHFAAVLARKPAVLSIDDPKAIPATYLVQPDPVPDRQAIKAAIADGKEVPGARIIRPNDYSLSIRSARK